MTRRFTFPAGLRINRRSHLRRAFRDGRRASDQFLRVWVIANGLAHARFAVSVGRRHGPAVHRNRLKRLLREAFRLSRFDLPSGLDIICAPHPCSDPSLDVYIESLGQLVIRATQHHGTRP